VRLVLDTNVLVSAFLNVRGKPAVVLSSLALESVTLLHDQRILNEYRRVLARPAFNFPRARVQEVLSSFEHEGKMVVAERLDVELPDPDDLPFLEVAFAGRADALVTGNLKHYPPASRCGVRVVGPAAYLRLLEAK
jgi:putative PIN family toxin of toxin-antitoxin system